MLSTRVKKESHFLLYVANVGANKQTRSVIQEITIQQILSLGEIFLNILKGNLKISSQKKKSLFQYRHLMRFLADSAKSDKAKRTLIKNQNIRLIQIIVILKGVLTNLLG